MSNYLSSVKDSEEFRARFDEISQLNIKNVRLLYFKAKPSIFETVIPEFLELPSLKANLEKLEIDSYFKENVNDFIKNWGKYREYAKLNKVTFI